MKTVVFYEPKMGIMEKLKETFPRHKNLVDQYSGEGKIIAIGTFANPAEGAMGIFWNRADAEEFIRLDPFVTEGLIEKISLREWNEILLK